ncbi:MAG: SCP2 sterol-binding domain-containing protein [Gammaproteobacteria bacterium]|nr:SCP2 sterol-binding domain-containing protein [Gammaproteobacteria bacterium]
MNNLEQVLGTFFADAATQVTQQALRSDASLRGRLLSLEGNSIQIECTIPSITWHLLIQDTALIYAHGKTEKPNVIVRGNLNSLASQLVLGNAKGGVEVEGDETLLLELMEMLTEFKPDLENHLAKIFGTQTASTLLGTAEMGMRGFQSVLEGIGRSVKQQAGGNFLQHRQFDVLLTSIDDLRLRVDRLAANITLQEQKRDPGSKHLLGSKHLG